MSNGISTGIPELQSEEDTEIAAKELEVARADSEFSSSIQEASVVGKATVVRAVSMLRPVLIGAAVLAGGALVISLFRGKKDRVSDLFAEHHAPSPWFELARMATATLATAAGRRLIDRWLASQRQH